METEASRLIDIVKKMEVEQTKNNSKLELANRELTQYRKKCQHKFEEKYDPIRTESYTIPGDPPGTMGIDWRGPLYVPAKTEDRWKRYCPKCGLEEYTTATKEIVRKVPKWKN
jgi:hypothetical protein